MFVTFDYKKNVHLRLIVSVVKSINLIPQTAILTAYREPMPAISPFNILGLKRENFENN